MQSSPSTIPRRRFIFTGASALAMASAGRLFGQTPSVNDEIAIGIVGCGGQGTGNMTNFLNIKGVRVVAVCDVDAGFMNRAKAMVDGHYKNQDCKTYAHYSDLLSHPGLDVVSLATPDHLHAMIGIAAAKAGKHVYGEKPFTWGLAEGRQLVDAVSANKCVWQTGSMQRSGGEFRRFKALINNNTLGKITRVECGTPAGMSVQQHVPADKVAEMIGKPPANLDWAGWCGPVKDFPYNPLLHPWNWRWHHTFGGGQLLDWVGHHVDIALWTLGLDRTGPVKMEGSGELVKNDFFNAFEKYTYQGTFENGQVVEVRSDFMGTKMTGEKGWIHVDRGRLEASDREMLRNLPADFNTKPPSHHQDFINCVREHRFNTASDPEGSHRASSFGQLALVAMDSKQPVNWDPKAEKVIGNAEQAAHPRLSSRVIG